ncbi:MAG: HAMP domain-containing sensor histidine kinase [Bdellovibrionales bacterium]|nr:HAMP domain-containing sensor histidine kinase [Bdellovibrionales bacterium]
MRNTYTLRTYPTILNAGDNKFFFIHCLLVSVHSLLLLGFVFYQFYQPLFLNSDIWVFVYLFLFFSFSIDFIYFYFYEQIKGKPIFQWSFLFLDAVLMTICLNAVIPVVYPVLIFIYMLQIFSAGLLGQYKGAFVQGLLVSFLFSWVMILAPTAAVEDTSSLLFSFVLNNMGFITVAGLSGFLGQWVNKMEWSLVTADKTLHQLEDLNELIVENINMGLFILDEDAFVIHSNRKALDILDLPSSFSASVHTVFPELKTYIQSVKGNKVGRLEVEYQGDPQNKTLEIFISPINEIRKYLILFQDCTKIRAMEEKEKEKEKFASIGRMAAGIAHELRNPLSSISGSVQLLDVGVNKVNTSENKRLIDLALREISRLNRIIGEFLDYASDENSVMGDRDREPVHVNSVLEELLDQVRVNPKWEHITYHFTLKAHGVVQGHTDKFKQIFLNVVKNACEAMEGQSSGHLEIESFDDNKWVVVKIKDTGVGISEKDKPYIYEPFYSKKEKGTGLGLSIVRKLVLLYKGHLSFCNRDKGGMICTIYFPIQPHLSPWEMAKRKSA